ncbi:MAG: hypothetical protein RLZZ436_217 [Planctomycetota bacterium]|jgi:hypothetical protein
MSKVIVLSGHGGWKLGDRSFVKVPARCSIKFFTMNMKTLSDGLGGDIDRGSIAGLEPDQEAGPFHSIPDMTLTPPVGLNIRTPDPATWHCLRLPCPLPFDNKNIQVTISAGYEADLSDLFEYLAPVIERSDSVTFLWAACRAIELKKAGGKALGVNKLQR